MDLEVCAELKLRWAIRLPLDSHQFMWHYPMPIGLCYRNDPLFSGTANRVVSSRSEP